MEAPAPKMEANMRRTSRLLSRISKDAGEKLMIWLAHQMGGRDGVGYFWQKASVCPDSAIPDRVPTKSMQLTGKYKSKIDAQDLNRICVQMFAAAREREAASTADGDTRLSARDQTLISLSIPWSAMDSEEFNDLEVLAAFEE